MVDRRPAASIAATDDLHISPFREDGVTFRHPDLDLVGRGRRRALRPRLQRSSTPAGTGPRCGSAPAASPQPGSSTRWPSSPSTARSTTRSTRPTGRSTRPALIWRRWWANGPARPRCGSRPPAPDPSSPWRTGWPRCCAGTARTVPAPACTHDADRPSGRRCTASNSACPPGADQASRQAAEALATPRSGHAEPPAAGIAMDAGARGGRIGCDRLAPVSLRPRRGDAVLAPILRQHRAAVSLLGVKLSHRVLADVLKDTSSAHG